MYEQSQPCCLIAEDQTLIGMGLEATLEDAGIAVAGPFPTCWEALAWGEDHTPEIAIVDYKLKDGTCTELVRALRERDVPVIIYSGYPHGEDLPAEFCGLTWLEKPTARADLLAAIAKIAPSVSERLAHPL